MNIIKCVPLLSLCFVLGSAGVGLSDDSDFTKKALCEMLMQDEWRRSGLVGGLKSSSRDLKDNAIIALVAIEWINRDKMGFSLDGRPYLYVEDIYADAVRFLGECRSPDAVKPLLPFLGVQFMVYKPAFAGMPTPKPEMTADDALKAIGLPAVDQILASVSQGELKDWQFSAARKLIVSVVGEKGAKARVAFLKLAKDEKVRKFLGGQ